MRMVLALYLLAVNLTGCSIPGDAIGPGKFAGQMEVYKVNRNPINQRAWLMFWLVRKRPPQHTGSQADEGFDLKQLGIEYRRLRASVMMSDGVAPVGFSVLRY